MSRGVWAIDTINRGIAKHPARKIGEAFAESPVIENCVRNPTIFYDFLLITPSTMTEAHPTGTYIPSGLYPIISVRARDGKGFNVGIAVQGYLTAN